MNIEKLEDDIQSLVTNLSEQSFIYDLLLAYDQPKSSITRLQKGDYNLSKKPGEILWKKKLFFKKETDTDLHSQIDWLKNDPAIIKHYPRFIIVTDFHTLLSIDTKTGDTLDIPILELPKHSDFYLPWAGMEKSQYRSENPADIKAAERMGKLYDIILQENSITGEAALHALNVFLSRLLFCFFAEDTGIFDDSQFTNAVASHTADDGSDLQAYLQRLFKVLNSRERHDYPKFLQAFRYVNGGLFADDYPVPKFGAKSRKIIIECGGLNWKAINPDILGSMMQAVVHNNQRSSMGMHYTSVVNIMKVVEPLFLNDFKEELEKSANNEKKLEKLLDRLYHMRIFDPACGSGNFLVIAYKELCKLEIEIYNQLQPINNKWKTAKSGLRLTQFYGIEMDDFAHETAKLSLWLAEHQMNLAFKEVFGEARPTLPLQDSGNIVCGNATQLDWEIVCPKVVGTEIYILGNPPYSGFSMQSKKQKDDMKRTFYPRTDYKRLDYIGCWFILAANYIKNQNAEYGFVSTNSITQGEQVALLWPYIFEAGLEIGFAYQSFKWTNNARGNAGVTCVVVGVRNPSSKTKWLFKDGIKHSVMNINPYLANGKNLVISKRSSSPLSKIPEMLRGDMPIDGGNFILSEEEKNLLLKEYPDSSKFIRKFIGASEFMNSTHRWCLWLNDGHDEAMKIEPIHKRVKAVKIMRLESENKSTQLLAETPYLFGQIRHLEVPSIIVPSTTSERRTYIPLAFIDERTIISNLAYSIPYESNYIFAIVSSLMHMTWVRAVAGRMKTDYRYSSGLCYNTFPFPDITDAQKAALEDFVFKVIDEREQHPEKTMAELYDPDKMPKGLRRAHHEMDLAVERCYRSRPFKDDEERLGYLFKMYEEMIEAEDAQGK